MLRIWIAALSVVVMAVSVAGQAQEPTSPSYVLSFPKPETHMFEVTITVPTVTSSEIELQMPTWTPGSYLQREYERNVQDFKADEGGRPLRWEKTNKSTWRVTTGASSASPRSIQITYRVFANELATQTSHLDSTHAYFNGASLFMYVP